MLKPDIPSALDQLISQFSIAEAREYVRILQELMQFQVTEFGYSPDVVWAREVQEVKAAGRESVVSTPAHEELLSISTRLKMELKHGKFKGEHSLNDSQIDQYVDQVWCSQSKLMLRKEMEKAWRQAVDQYRKGKGKYAGHGSEGQGP